MANQFFQLPTPVGNGVGAAVNVSTLTSNKTILIGGTFDAVVEVQVSTDGGATFGPVLSFQDPTVKPFVVSATHMRLRVSGLLNGTPIVYVGGFVTNSRSAIMAVPVGNGSGASTNISAYGSSVTLVVAGTDFSGSVAFEVSDDNVNFSPFQFFTGAGIVTAECNASFIRVTRAGVGFNVNLPVIAVAAANEEGDAGSISLTQPAPQFVFRPFDPAGDHDNVYTTWAGVYAALQASASRGRRFLQFDTTFAPVGPRGLGTGDAARVAVIPAGTWNMENVIWTNMIRFVNAATASILLADNCFIELLAYIDGNRMKILSDSTISSPITLGGVGLFGTRTASQLFGGANTQVCNTARKVSISTNTVAIAPLAVTIDVASTAVFPSSGRIQIGEGAEWVDYTGKTATQFTGVTAVVGAYPIGTKIQVPNAITNTPAFTPILAGATTITVIATAAFPSSGSLSLNFGAETVTYTGKTATTFTGVSPVVGSYTGGTYIEDVGAGAAGTIIKPLYVVAPGGIFGNLNGSGAHVFGGLGQQNVPCPAPLVDIPVGSFFFPSNFNFENNAYSGPVGSSYIANIHDAWSTAGGAGNMTWFVPNFLGTTLTPFNYADRTKFRVRTAVPITNIVTNPYLSTYTEFVQVNTAAATFITIPTGLRAFGETFVVRNTIGGGVGAITLTARAGETVNGAATLVIATTAVLISNGAGAWFSLIAV